MANKNYVSGRRFEYAVKKELEKRGWIAIRSAGSHSPFDIIAIKGGKILLLQLKHYKNGIMPLNEYKKEMMKLFKLNIAKTLKPLLAIIQDKKGLQKAINITKNNKKERKISNEEAQKTSQELQGIFTPEEIKKYELRIGGNDDK